MYWVTVHSENPNDAEELWPTITRSRSSSGFVGELAAAMTPVAGDGTSAGAMGPSGDIVSSRVKYGWAGMRRGSMFNLRAPAKFRKLRRTMRAPGEVPAPLQRLVETAMLDPAVVPQFCGALTRRDSFENIDVDAEGVPIMSHWHKDAPHMTGEPAAEHVSDASEDVFDVLNLGRSPGEHCDAVVRASAAAMVMFATFVDVLHPKLAFPAGLLVCKQLVNDYKYGAPCRL